MVVTWIVCFNDQEKTITGSHRKIRGIEHRVIGLGKFVQKQHSQHCRKCGDKHGAFECDRNERRPTVKGLATYVDRVIDNFDPVLQEKTTESANHPTN